MLNNIFTIGGQVFGESFIGRKELLKHYRDEFINSPQRKIFSVVGLSRSGKTSFIKNVFKDNVPDSVFYYYVDISLCNSYFSIWYSLLENLNSYLELNASESVQDNRLYPKLISRISEIISLDNELDMTGLYWEKFQNTIRTIFKILKKINIRSILVFDEFDHAKDIFVLGTPQFSLFRTLFADGDMDVSAITISRRKVEDIEGKIYQSSTLANVMDFHPFSGFNEDDISEYFSIFSNKYGLVLSDKIKQNILYYAGNLPYLLSIIGHYIVDDYEKNVDLDIDSIFNEKCTVIKSYYESCLNELTRNKHIKKIIAYVIGPTVNVTKTDRIELMSIGYLSVRNADSSYFSISEYFCSMLSSKMLELPLWDEIINLEKKLKSVIRIEMPNILRDKGITGKSVNELETKILKTIPFIGQKTLEQWNSFALSADTYVFSTMNFIACLQILNKFWDGYYKKYFKNLNYEELSPKFTKCAKARNPLAHGNDEKALSEADRNEVNAYCNEIFDMLGTTFTNNYMLKDDAELFKNFITSRKR